ncbi:unnamed protein product [Lactuca virosa]|uniref:Uncharacterized protein n=1 Tax=Lactuca virosa TaxID=75947 RepID=A0AAU9LUG4_9ASTR|nr:unnamed protein product [Lactuca virosa]
MLMFSKCGDEIHKPHKRRHSIRSSTTLQIVRLNNHRSSFVVPPWRTILIRKELYLFLRYYNMNAVFVSLTLYGIVSDFQPTQKLQSGIGISIREISFNFSDQCVINSLHGLVFIRG